METTNDESHQRVLSIYPNYRGFAYTLFSGPRELVDWGVKSARSHKNARSLANLRAQIDLYQPDVLVIEDYEGQGSRRAPRIRKLLGAIEVLGGDLGIAVCKYSPAQVRGVFELFGATTKYEIATFIDTSLPADLPMPPVRKAWMSEDYRMGVFDAAAYGITHYYLTT